MPATKYIGYVDEDVIRMMKTFENYWIGQRGGVLPVFTEFGIFPQRGKGLGSVLRGVWTRLFKPALISGVKTVGRQALSSTGEYLGDLAAGQNWKTAGRKRLSEAGDALADKLQSKISRMSGSGQYGEGQFGGANKADLAAIKLFSLTPPGVQRGRVVRRRIKRSVAAKRQRSTKNKKPKATKRKKKTKKKPKNKKKTQKTKRKKQQSGSGSTFPLFQ